ncbi:ParB N-terminal domain-containing protein [Streptomyces sp. NPDC088560]|uniref:ParB N-terminal domain-containing protein n=1 Tax=Streptomyces sp. NPDC088560 TaxID=3365868 RepID=UPI00380537C2
MKPEPEMPQEALMLDALTAGRPTAPVSGAFDQPVSELVPIASLVTSDSPRIAGEDAEHVEALAEMRNPLPPIVVHRPTMRIVDGVHRLRAAVLRGEDSIEVRYVEGSAEDAFVLAVRLNAEHGMPLSRRDRLSAAERIIDSHAHWSDRRIAEVTGLAPATVSSLRRRSTAHVDQLNARTGRDGRSRPVNSAAGRRRAGQVIAERPNASLREIAQEAGIALATARDVRLRIREGKDPVPPKLREAAQESNLPGARAVRKRPVAQEPERVVRARPEPALISDAGRLVNLRKDPSLRFSEAGRALLQLLATNALDDEKWRWLMGAVPEHRNADIARAARHCGERWLSFAEGLEHGGGARTGRAV